MRGFDWSAGDSQAATLLHENTQKVELFQPSEKLMLLSDYNKLNVGSFSENGRGDFQKIIKGKDFVKLFNPSQYPESLIWTLKSSDMDEAKLSTVADDGSLILSADQMQVNQAALFATFGDAVAGTEPVPSPARPTTPASQAGSPASVGSAPAKPAGQSPASAAAEDDLETKAVPAGKRGRAAKAKAKPLATADIPVKKKTKQAGALTAGRPKRHMVDVIKGFLKDFIMVSESSELYFGEGWPAQRRWAERQHKDFDLYLQNTKDMTEFHALQVERFSTRFVVFWGLSCLKSSSVTLGGRGEGR